MSSNFRNRAVVAVLVGSLLTASAASAEPIRLLSPSKCETANGSEIELDPGVFLPDDDYDALDLEMRRLQERETRLAAENHQLRNTPPGSWWIPAALGIAAGVAIGWKLNDS